MTKKKTSGIVIPKELIYGLILSVLAGAYTIHNEVKENSIKLKGVEEKIEEKIEDVQNDIKDLKNSIPDVVGREWSSPL